MTGIAGIDLAGVPERPTGYALLKGMKASRVKVLYSNQEIIEEVIFSKPELVSIDAPLGLPKGRHCFSPECKKCAGKSYMREAERELVRRGIRVFPCGFMGMQKLTLRGIDLAKKLKKKGYKVIESYPGSVQDILGIPRKKKGLEELRRGLIGYGIKGAFAERKVSDHELDAITSALVGKMFLQGKTISLGLKSEERIVVPALGQTTLKKPLNKP